MLIHNYDNTTLTLAAQILSGRQQSIEQLITEVLCKEIQRCTIGEILHFLESKREIYGNFIER